MTGHCGTAKWIRRAVSCSKSMSMDYVKNLFSRHKTMADFIYMMNTLVDNKGNILIPGIMDDVAPVADEESATYGSIDFDLDHSKKTSAVKS